MSDAGEYEKARPHVQAHVDKYLQVLERVRSTHAGLSFDEVFEALNVEFDAEGIKVGGDVARDAARLISGQEGVV